MARTARRPFHRPLRAFLIGCAAVGLVAAGAGNGCSSKKKNGPKGNLPERYAKLPKKKVPAFLQDTILEQCDLINTEPFLVSGYSVVVNLDNTGDGSAPNLVREYIVKEMFKHRWNSPSSGINMPPPEQALRDPRVAMRQDSMDHMRTCHEHPRADATHRLTPIPIAHPPWSHSGRPRGTRGAALVQGLHEPPGRPM